jgi:hypothetical protein
MWQGYLELDGKGRHRARHAHFATPFCLLRLPYSWATSDSSPFRNSRKIIMAKDQILSLGL